MSETDDRYEGVMFDTFELMYELERLEAPEEVQQLMERVVTLLVQDRNQRMLSSN